MRPLDIVEHCESDAIGVVTEVNEHGDCVVHWFNNPHLHSAWFSPRELEELDNLASALTKNLAHSMSSGYKNPYKK